MKCKKCNGFAVKNGKQSNGKQRYYCKQCKCSFQRSYHYQAYHINTNKNIYLFLKEGVGISATSRLLSISKTTVIKRIKLMASQITKPILHERHQYYELDEMRVVVGYKQQEAWVTYAINRYTKQVVNFIVGRRSKRNLSVITKSVLQLYPKRVFTDRLKPISSLFLQNNITLERRTQLLLNVIV